MKNIFTALVLTAVAITANAGSSIQYCAGIADAAHMTMQARQSGVDMGRLLELTDNDSLLTEMVIQAYESPKFSTESYKTESAQEFKNTYYVACLKAAK